MDSKYPAIMLRVDADQILHYPKEFYDWLKHNGVNHDTVYAVDYFPGLNKFYVGRFLRDSGGRFYNLASDRSFIASEYAEVPVLVPMSQHMLADLENYMDYFNDPENFELPPRRAIGNRLHW
jgi:hypothetical protein